MKYFILINLFGLLISASGCSLMQATPDKTLHVNWQDPQKFYFQGKGAGAGMALMSTMGAMGMAIGVAIDDGISKEISKTQQTSGKTIEDLLYEVTTTSNVHIKWQNTKSNSLPSLTIERIEFNIVRGDNDATGVKIKALYTDKDSNQKQLNYPKDIPDYIAPSFPLEQLKTNNKLANELLIEGFKQLFSSIK